MSKEDISMLQKTGHFYLVLTDYGVALRHNP